MPAVVVDTDVASYLHKKDSRARLFRSHLIGREWVISFMTVAELYEWGLRARWGPFPYHQKDVVQRVHGRLHSVAAQLRGAPEHGEPAQRVLWRRLRRLLRL